MTAAPPRGHGAQKHVSTGFGADLSNNSMADRVEIPLDGGSRLTLQEFSSLERIPELIFLSAHYTAAIAPELIRLGALIGSPDWEPKPSSAALATQC